MSLEKEKVDYTNDDNMHYDRKDNNVQRMTRENDGTGVERLQPSMEGDSYKSVSKQLQFLINSDTCIKKQIKQNMK